MFTPYLKTCLLYVANMFKACLKSCVHIFVVMFTSLYLHLLWNYVYIVFEYMFNKLGQCQSQTPFSSAFWVQKHFSSKTKAVSKKCLVQKMLGWKKFGVQKYFRLERNIETSWGWAGPSSAQAEIGLLINPIYICFLFIWFGGIGWLGFVF